MKINKISLMIGGEAGAGISRSGFLFAKACLRGGLHVFGTNDYQSLIRGGHNFYIVRVDNEEVFSQFESVDLLLALNKETILIHKDEIVPHGGIIYDGENFSLSNEELGREDIILYSVPLKQIVNNLKGQLIVRNTIGLGVVMSLIAFNLDHLIGVIKDTFNSKVADLNVKALTRGWNFAQKHFAGEHNYQVSEQKVGEKKRIFLNGNEAIGLAALRAGCKFYVTYPMTPATGLLHFMASFEREYGIIVVHAESEISAINMVAGASFAGVRAMTATSGGGFCLMSEGLGMLGMTENPAVIMVAQRPGPSTGLPTYSGQGDLRFVIHASHGEFPRLVIAPGDVEECFYKTLEAFNLAEKYQMPVVILTDKYLVESYEGVNTFDIDRIGIDRGKYLTEKDYESEEKYQRHKLTSDGISPRAIPGMKGVIVRTNSNEHDETGYTTDNPEVTIKMVNKRFRKRETLVRDLENYETVKLYGSMRADVTLFGWGTTKRPIREAMKLLCGEDLKINFLQIVYLEPFPTDKVRKILQLAQKTIVVEENKTSQLSSLIREHTLMTIDHEILKYDGRPFNPLELAQKIKDVF